MTYVLAMFSGMFLTKTHRQISVMFLAYFHDSHGENMPKIILKISSLFLPCLTREHVANIFSLPAMLSACFPREYRALLPVSVNGRGRRVPRLAWIAPQAEGENPEPEQLTGLDVVF